MELMIRIKTPKGYAASTEKKLRPFIIGLRRVDHEILTNKDDTQILWIINSGSKDYCRIVRNVALYDKMLHKVLDSKKVRKVAKLDKKQEKELDEMLFNQTEVEMIPKLDREKLKKKFKKSGS